MGKVTTLPILSYVFILADQTLRKGGESAVEGERGENCANCSLKLGNLENNLRIVIDCVNQSF